METDALGIEMLRVMHSQMGYSSSDMYATLRAASLTTTENAVDKTFATLKKNGFVRDTFSKGKFYITAGGIQHVTDYDAAVRV